MQRSTLTRGAALAGALVLATVGLACEPAAATTPDPTLPEATVPELETTTTTEAEDGPALTTTTTTAPLPPTTVRHQFVDLDCGDEGTFHNMPVTPDDPHGLDADGDGLGCEDASVFPGGSAGTPEDTAPPIGPGGATGAPQTQGAGEELPRTGNTTAPLLALGGALLTIGAAAFLVRGKVRTQ